MPDWNREEFRDAWMSSGVNTVSGMQDWLKKTGYDQLVGTGGSKGDKMFLPNGDIIDAIAGAGIGGGIAPPAWTGQGNWKTGAAQPGSEEGIGPSGGMMQNWMGQDPQEMAKQRQMQEHQMFRNRQQARHNTRGLGPSAY